jgi:hypothetical protein
MPESIKIKASSQKSRQQNLRPKRLILSPLIPESFYILNMDKKWDFLQKFEKKNENF